MKKLPKKNEREREREKKHILEVGGGESFCETANREIVSFRSCVRASERARDQRFDCAARAVVRPV